MSDVGPGQASEWGGVVSVGMSRRLAVVLLVPIVLLAACSGGDDAATSTTFAPPLTNPPLPTTPGTTTTFAETTTTSATTTVVETTTASSVPDSTPTITESPAPAATTPNAPGDDDWVAIIQGLSDVLVELQGEPNPERITEFCLEGENDCQNIQGEAIRQFASEGWVTLDFPRSEILSAELSIAADDLPPGEAPFIVLLVDKGPADFSDARVVDSHGEVIFEISSDGDGGRSNWILARNSEERWRVVGIQSLGEQ